MRRALLAGMLCGSALIAGTAIAAPAAVAAPGDVQSVSLQQIGQSSLPVLGLDGMTQPRGNNGDIAVLKNTAYIGGGAAYYGSRATSGRICSDWGGVKVVNLADPSTPTQLGPINVDDPNGIGAPWPATNPRRAAPADFYDNVATSVTGVDAESVQTTSFTGDILAVMVFRCEPNFFSGGRLEFWNVSNPAAPVLLNPGAGTIPLAPATSEDVQIVERGTRLFAVTTVPFGNAAGTQGELRVYDITNPMAPPAAAPGQIGFFPTVGIPQGTNNGCNTFASGRDLSPLGANGDEFFLSFYDGTDDELDDDADTEAVIRLNMANTFDTGTVPVKVAPTMVSNWGYPDADSSREGKGTDRDEEGNAAHLENYSAGGKPTVIVSEDDPDPSLTRFDLTAPGFPTSKWRACELLLAPKIASLPGQQLTDDVAYLGRGCPATPLTVSAGDNQAVPDPYLDNPTGKIAVLDGGPSPFNGCSARERYQRAIDAGAVAVMSTTGQNLLNTTNSGPTGGAVTAPAMTITGALTDVNGGEPDGAFETIQRVASSVLSTTTFSTTWTRSTASNVTMNARPGRTDFGRFRSEANATDRAARAEVNAANRFAVSPTQSFDVSAFMEVPTYTGGTFQTSIAWYDTNGVLLSTSPIQSLSAVTPETQFSATVTAPAMATSAAARLTWGGTPADEGVAHVFGFNAVPDNLTTTIDADKDEAGGQKFVDFSTNDPQQVGVYRSPNSMVWPSPTPDGIYAPRQARVLNDEIAFTTWLSDGLRVLNVKNPANPVELASFVEPATPDPSPASGAGTSDAPPLQSSASLELNRGRAWPDVPLANGVEIVSGGDQPVIAMTDINGGLYVFRATITREQAATVTPPPTITPPGPTPTNPKAAIKKCKKKFPGKAKAKQRKKCIKKAKKRAASA